MAMKDLLAARVDLSLRGIMTQLVSNGWRLDDPSTGRRAAGEFLQEHPGRRGNRVRDVHAIAQDVRRSLLAGQRLNEGEGATSIQGIPRTASAERSSGERFRYFVVVVVDDPAMGGETRIPLTITSGTPLTKTDLWMHSATAIGNGNYDDNYKGRSGAFGPPRLRDIVVVQIDRAY